MSFYFFSLEKKSIQKCIKLIFMSFNKTWNARKKFPTSWSGNFWEPFDQLPVNIAHYGDNCYVAQPIIIHLHLNNTLRGESIFKSKNFRGVDKIHLLNEDLPFQSYFLGLWRPALIMYKNMDGGVGLPHQLLFYWAGWERYSPST